jgi:lysosomal Pro-X carboxypeptidase
MVIPIGVHTDDTMFPQSPYDLNNFTKFCKETYGVSSRPHWITTYYGGHDIKLVLQRFASNIIFSNGLRDPYSTGGILENISDTVLSIHTKNGSHVLDILQATQDDPAWLVMQRKREVEVIQGWLKQYYVDLYAVKGY